MEFSLGGIFAGWNFRGWNFRGWNFRGWNFRGWNFRGWNFRGWNFRITHPVTSLFWACSSIAKFEPLPILTLQSLRKKLQQSFWQTGQPAIEICSSYRYIYIYIYGGIMRNSRSIASQDLKWKTSLNFYWNFKEKTCNSLLKESSK